ncbi:MAG: hypothetical protein IKF42_13315, partial [Mogibacterium sp.]|nr:hypothetical protein [Mogibacterium sp.]
MVYRKFDFNIGITEFSALMPLSLNRDNGIINNGKADRIKDMEEKRPSVLEQLKAEPPEIDHPGK